MAPGPASRFVFRYRSASCECDSQQDWTHAAHQGPGIVSSHAFSFSRFQVSARVQTPNDSTYLLVSQSFTADLENLPIHFQINVIELSRSVECSKANMDRGVHLATRMLKTDDSPSITNTSLVTPLNSRRCAGAKRIGPIPSGNNIVQIGLKCLIRQSVDLLLQIIQCIFLRGHKDIIDNPIFIFFEYPIAMCGILNKRNILRTETDVD